MIVLAILAGVIALWSFADTLAAFKTGHDPAIYLRVAILATLVAIGFLFLAEGGV